VDSVGDVEGIFDRREDRRVGPGRDECAEEHVPARTHPAIERKKLHTSFVALQG
jgi:hypothetical protein